MKASVQHDPNGIGLDGERDAGRRVGARERRAESGVDEGRGGGRGEVKDEVGLAEKTRSFRVREELGRVGGRKARKEEHCSMFLVPRELSRELQQTLSSSLTSPREQSNVVLNPLLQFVRP